MIEEPKCFQTDYVYLDEEKGWRIKPDAPEDMKNEFEEFMKAINAEPDDNDIVTQY